MIRGTQIVKDGTYTYSKNKGYNEPKVAQEFSYYTEAKTDSTHGMAAQSLWSDTDKSELLSRSSIDFNNSRLMNVEYDEHGQAVCTVTQFMSTLMDSRRMLDWLWQPSLESPVTYMGLQCLHLENQTVHGFSGTDSEGVPW